MCSYGCACNCIEPDKNRVPVRRKYYDLQYAADFNYRLSLQPLVGCLTGVVYGLIQMLFGMSNFAYATSWQAALMILFFDYLIAFGVIGLGGVFRGIKNQAVGLALGALLASVLRFLCHFLSGITVWAGFADGMPVWLYSLIYNGLYMLPEFGVLIAAAIALGLLVDFRSEKLGAVKRAKK